MARPRSKAPKLVLRGKIYYVRLTYTIDGLAVRKWVSLQTSDRALAKARAARAAREAAAGQLSDVTRTETLREAARRLATPRVLEVLERHVLDELGDVQVDKLRAVDVTELLEKLASAGQSKQSCIHVRNAVSHVLGKLWRADIVPENVCRKVQIPKNAHVDQRYRVVLTLEELRRYLEWQHPVESRRRAVVERQTMACLALLLGGQRWGDVRATRWEHFSLPHFERAWIQRRKTRRPQAVIVPEPLRAILRRWHEACGSPPSGVMFPLPDGRERKTNSIAKYFRKDLRRAFGIEEPVARAVVRRNGRKDLRISWRVARAMTERERELFVPTEFTLPVDFHSFRRAFKQALLDAGVDGVTAMLLSGASDARTHARYLVDPARPLALPSLWQPGPAAEVEEKSSQKQPIYEQNARPPFTVSQF